MTFETIGLAENPLWATLLNGRAYSARLVEFSGINFDAAFKYACDLSRVRSPQEFADVVANQMREQFEALSEQFEELSATTQGASSENDPTESGFGD
jgi:hypothetical protein